MLSVIRSLAQIWLLFSAALLIAGNDAQAEDHALIVGVSQYTEPSLPDLEGAANDARLFADLARKRGIAEARLRVLSHATNTPTAQAIQDAFEQLITAVSAGDKVLIVLSGHGIAYRDRGALSEDDGLTEAFLAADARQQRDTGLWRGAIADDMLSMWLKALAAKGAQVLLVADFCESGGVLRSGSYKAGRARSPRLAKLLSSPTGRETGISALLASPQGQAARQGLGPPWLPLERQSAYGLLSLYTALALEQPGLFTMGAVADWVAARMAQHSASPAAIFIGDRAQPVFLDSASFKASHKVEEGPQPARWLAQIAPTAAQQQSPDSIEVQAGALAGLFDGARARLIDFGPQGAHTILTGRIAKTGILSAHFIAEMPVSAYSVADPRWSDVRRADGSRALDGGIFFVELTGAEPATAPHDRHDAMLAAARWASQMSLAGLLLESASIAPPLKTTATHRSGSPICQQPGTAAINAARRQLLPIENTRFAAPHCSGLVLRVTNRSADDRLVQLAAFGPDGTVLLLPDPGADYHLLAPGEAVEFAYQLTELGVEEFFALSIDADYPMAERRLLRTITPLRSSSGPPPRVAAAGGLQAVSLTVKVGG
ncbi:caspase family protein [Parasphingorhabdus sp. DH2-15]|uniref:caspase family protein n=1 Tax=Parasphingorhabdus sp. DH2-15 TaxID=3444112 RepID=UPI003F688828